MDRTRCIGPRGRIFLIGWSRGHHDRGAATGWLQAMMGSKSKPGLGHHGQLLASIQPIVPTSARIDSRMP